MLRNHSDLGCRIRKRVTYRLNSVPLRQFGEPVKYDDVEVINSIQNPNFEMYDEDVHGNIENSVLVRTNSADDIAEEVFSNESFDSKADDIAHDKNENQSHPRQGTCRFTDATFIDNTENTDTNETEVVQETDLDIYEQTNNADDFEEDSYDDMNHIGHCEQEQEGLLKIVDNECIVNIDACENHRLILPRTTSQECVVKVDTVESDHVVLLPLGSVEALKADSSDV